ncbi:MAG TPA: PAS domain S-box protein, partial [Polyangiaceae bacterium]
METGVPPADGRAAESARESYRAMFESIPQPMFVLDPATHGFLEVNEAATRQYGYAREEFLGMRAVDLWLAEDCEKNSQIITQAPSRDPAIVRHRKKDGTHCWVEVRASALSFEGRASRLVLVTDVTQRFARFARLSDSGIIGIIVTSADVRVLEVNRALADLVGHSREDILSGRVDWAALTPNEWRPNDARAMAQLDDHGVASLREKEYTRKDGTRVPVLAGSARLPGPAGDTISFVLDLRGSKEAAAAVAHLREARASEALLRDILEATPDAMAIADRDGKLVFVNSQMERMFGYTREELVGQPSDMLIPSRLRESYGRRIADNFVEPRPTDAGPREGHGLRKDGTEFTYERTVTRLEALGRPLLCGSMRDITERHRAAVDLSRAKEAAES